MKKFALALILCSTLTCSAFSCGSSEKNSSAKESSPAVTEITAEPSSEPATTTLGPKAAEMMEKAKSNLKKSLEKAKNEHSAQLHNTDEMDTEANKVVRQFAEAVFSDDAEAMAQAMYPPKMLEGMKACGEYDSFSESVNDGETMPLTSLTVRYCVRLKDDEKALAESYINFFAKEYGLSSNEYTVTEGYSFMADMESREDGSVRSAAEGLIIINIANEGWKIIPISLSELTK